MNDKIYTIKRRLARFAKILLRRDVYFRNECRVSLRRFGDRYGGWDLCPKGLGQDSIVYSFGAGTNISFDLDLIRDFSMSVHCFDPSPQSIDYMKSCKTPDSLIFHPWGVGKSTSTMSFYKPCDKRLGSLSIVGGVEFEAEGIPCEIRCLNEIMLTLGHEHVDILKMDIEGAEYDVIESLAGDNRHVFDQILVEFHHRFSSISTEKTRTAINQLQLLDYKIISVSASGEEYGFAHASYLDRVNHTIK